MFKSDFDLQNKYFEICDNWNRMFEHPAFIENNTPFVHNDYDITPTTFGKPATTIISNVTSNNKKNRKKQKLNKDPKYRESRNIKLKAKLKNKLKFKIGSHYFLNFKSKRLLGNIVLEYVCVKVIYAIRNIPVNIVIMKQISNFNNKKYCLTPSQCKIYHIKYEPGLQVCSMNLNWIPEKTTKNEKY